MPKIKYVDYKPQGRSAQLIEKSVEILEEYVAQGYTLTLRQLYYQLVSRDVVPNSQKSYNSLGGLISKARDGGLIDWSHIEDRTRTVESNPSWEGRDSFLRSVIPQYHHDLWEGQPERVFVFVEKEALEQVVSIPATRWDCPYLANKGYLSSSSVWNVAHNMMRRHPDCRSFVVIHLGDHDPSGIDMTRDINERLKLYAGARRSKPSIKVDRIALNMDQIEEYSPPPNPAKQTDSRFSAYQEQFGDESWELDALQPSIIEQLIDEAIQRYVDIDLWSLRRDEKEIVIEEMEQAFGLN